MFSRSGQIIPAWKRLVALVCVSLLVLGLFLFQNTLPARAATAIDSNGNGKNVTIDDVIVWISTKDDGDPANAFLIGQCLFIPGYEDGNAQSYNINAIMRASTTISDDFGIYRLEFTGSFDADDVPVYTVCDFASANPSLDRYGTLKAKGGIFTIVDAGNLPTSGGSSTSPASPEIKATTSSLGSFGLASNGVYTWTIKTGSNGAAELTLLDGWSVNYIPGLTEAVKGAEYISVPDTNTMRTLVAVVEKSTGANTVKSFIEIIDERVKAIPKPTLQGIEVATRASLTYKLGDELKDGDIIVKAIYSDGSKATVTSYTTNLATATSAGKATGTSIPVTVTYTKDEITVTGRFYVTITDPNPVRLASASSFSTKTSLGTGTSIASVELYATLSSLDYTGAEGSGTEVNPYKASVTSFFKADDGQQVKWASITSIAANESSLNNTTFKAVLTGYNEQKFDVIVYAYVGTASSLVTSKFKSATLTSLTGTSLTGERNFTAVHNTLYVKVELVYKVGAYKTETYYAIELLMKDPD